MTSFFFLSLTAYSSSSQAVHLLGSIVFLYFSVIIVSEAEDRFHTSEVEACVSEQRLMWEDRPPASAAREENTR